ncbi:MAG: hypothetical protein Q9227_005647 [Pyrenula ochraceoflavens]
MVQPTEGPIWQPPDPERTPMSIYRRHINSHFGLNLKDSIDLYEWSISRPHEFWIDLYRYCGITPALPREATKAYDDSRDIASIPPFFSGHSLNYAENILANRNASAVALVGLREGQNFDGKQGEFVTWADLRERVRQVRSSLLRHGVHQGDRVAALMGNSVLAVVIFLATAAIGAIFTSINPDMGAEGCISRLSQIQPKALFADSHATYKGKRFDLKEKISDILKALQPFKPQYFIVPVHGIAVDQSPCFRDFLEQSSPADALTFARVPFSAPLLILYSSGTSGPPKCIVHSHGLILQHKKIALLHNSLSAADRVMAYSSTSWVVWNVMVGYLSVGATVICYDGSPLFPSAKAMLRLVQNYKACFFATSPRYLLELEKEQSADGTLVKHQFDLSSLRLVTTTGSALTASAMRSFYRSFPPHVHLSSVAGGTDIATSWLATNPAGPLYAGEIQMGALGMAVDVADPDSAHAISIKLSGQPGELICRIPFPSMPPFFWGDSSSSFSSSSTTSIGAGPKYHSSYFTRFTPSSPPFPSAASTSTSTHVWAQHDLISHHPTTGGWTMHGRSDATLNPSGIRFGSADIYNILESSPYLRHRVAESLCVGRRNTQKSEDEEVFLFLKMKPEYSPLTEGFKREVKETVRKGLSARHVPGWVEEVGDVPVTGNGKKVEGLVKRIIAGEWAVGVGGPEKGKGLGVGKGGQSTVANPECLEEYVKFAHTGMKAKL